QGRDAYRDKQWVPPDRDKAKEEAAAEKYRRGKAPLLDTTFEELGELGVGLVIYFKVLYILACTFTLMSTVALPAMYINRSGA
ncbi:unnamed protein product, partial [Sphacelaria rigidula]